MFLLIDNYGSFTYNLAQAFLSLGETPLILKNDDPRILDLAADKSLKRVCLASGTGRPERAGLNLEFLKSLEANNPQTPVLGVGLGHQILAQHAGAELEPASIIRQGRSAWINHDGRGLFAGVPQAFQAACYHSWLAVPGKSKRFLVTGLSEAGEPLSLAYEDRPWVGVQFHPESILTPEGLKIFINFLKIGPSEIGHPLWDSVFEPPPPPISEILELLGSGQDLDFEVAKRVFRRLMDDELSAVQAGAFLLGLRTKGETPLEIAAAAEAVLEKAVKAPILEEPALDVVGTGGDNQNSFNCSTAAALVMAGLGFKVVKHGNRSISSRCGSADVLERLGVSLNSPPEELPQDLARRNFAFLFAPHYHPAFKYIMPARKELGIRTVFNLLGPLVNPARPSHRLIGVPRPEYLELIAGALAHFGGVTAAVVHGAGGYDELTTLGPAQIIWVRGKKLEKTTLDPQAYGFQPSSPEELKISGPQEGEEVLRRLLQGQGPEAMREMLILNVGLALRIMTGRALDVCFQEARRAVESGVGSEVLHA